MKRKGFFDPSKLHIYYGPEWDQDLPKEETCYEVHADGVKEVKCDSCTEPCGNEWCCMNEEKQ